MNILFDLDGTLTDAYPGIVNSLRHTMAAMGRPAPPTSALRPLIGPPLREGLASLLETEDEEILEAAVGHYRGYFADRGMYENAVYPGIREALEAMGRRGARLWVVTSKTEHFARKIVSYFGLARFFSGVTGSRADGSLSSKARLIAGLMARASLDKDRTVMVGDRHFDIVGALENRIAAVGVLWGYGDAKELSAAGACALCPTPDALPDTIGTLMA